MDETRDSEDTPSEDGARDEDRPVPPPRPLRVVVMPAVHDQARPEPRRRTRRWFVAGAAALVTGGAAGVAVDFVRGRPSRPTPPAPPTALRAAIDDERALLDGARAARQGRGDGLPAAVLAVMVRDHAAHLAALTAAAAGYAAPRATASRVPPVGPGDRTVLRRREQQASHRAVERARQLQGDAAALLASIAACEATHAELLS